MITYKSFFFIGIKGVMMANLAVILKKKGKKVTGADVDTEFITDPLLKKHSIDYYSEFSEQILPKDIDCIVYAASHKGTNNPVVIAGKKRNIKIMSQPELLGELMKEFKTSIAISGCHGKTTTASLLSCSLIQLDQKPSYCVGVPYFGKIHGSDYQDNKYFIVEADEYGVDPPLDKTPKFNYLNPEYIICTNIDFDHPDIYLNLEDVKKAFLKFFNNKKLILCIDDVTISQMISRLKNDVLITYGYSVKAQYQIKNVKSLDMSSQFEIFNNVTGKLSGMFSTCLFGEKNISNVAAVVVTLLELGFDISKIQSAIKDFKGAERRFEELYHDNNIHIYDDYAHHPNEIKATIDAARKKFPNNRLIIIFQPHTYSRTQILLKEFASSLSQADYAYILPIFSSAREDKEQFSISSHDIVKDQPNKNLFAFDSKDDLLNFLKQNIRKNDIIFTMGAGDVYKLKDDIIKVISNI